MISSSSSGSRDSSDAGDCRGLGGLWSSLVSLTTSMALSRRAMIVAASLTCNGMLGSLEEDDEEKRKKKEREKEAVLDTCNSAIRQTRQLES